MDMAQRQQLDYGKAQNLFELSQMVFLCNERDKLVAELRHILHVRIGGNPIYEEKCRFSTELEPTPHELDAQKKTKLLSVFNHLRLSAFVRLHPSAIQVLSRQPEAEL